MEAVVTRRRRRCGVGLAAVLLAQWAAPVAAGSRAGAEARCPAPAFYLAWPETEPVWELCWTRPRDSSGAAGSGLELTSVRFRGRPVLDRAGAPAVWARYAPRGEPGCAGRCTSSPTSGESPFAAGAPVVPGWHEPDTTAAPAALWPRVTVCDRPAGTAPGDCPWGEPLACAAGVAIERGDDTLRLTTQLAAGGFRYVMSWTFHLDGTLEPRFAFGRGDGACAATPVREHVLWRFDFDLGTTDRLLPAAGGAGWRIGDGTAGRGFRVAPGAGDLEPALHPSADTADPIPDLGDGCGFDPEALPPFDPAGRGGAGDLVVWYHAAAEGSGTDCRTVGPTLTPTGAWPSPGELIFEDGLESGDTSSWTSSTP